MRTTACIFVGNTSGIDLLPLKSQCDSHNIELIVPDFAWLFDTSKEQLEREITKRINTEIDVPVNGWSNLRQWLSHLCVWAMMSQLPLEIETVIVLERGQNLDLGRACLILNESLARNKQAVTLFGHFALPSEHSSSVRTPSSEILYCGTCVCRNSLDESCGHIINGKSLGTVGMHPSENRRTGDEFYELISVVDENLSLGPFTYGFSRDAGQSIFDRSAGRILKNQWLLTQPFQFNLGWCPIHVLLSKLTDPPSTLSFSPLLLLTHRSHLCGGAGVSMIPSLPLFDSRAHLKQSCESAPQSLLALMKQIDSEIRTQPVSHRAVYYERLTQLSLTLAVPELEKQFLFQHWFNESCRFPSSPSRSMALWHAAIWHNNHESWDLAWMYLKEAQLEQGNESTIALSQPNIWQSHLDYVELQRFEFQFELIRAGLHSSHSKRFQWVHKLAKDLVIRTQDSVLKESQQLRLRDLLLEIHPSLHGNHAWIPWSFTPSAAKMKTFALVIGAEMVSEKELGSFQFLAQALSHKGYSIFIFCDQLPPNSFISNPRVLSLTKDLGRWIEKGGSFDVAILTKPQYFPSPVAKQIYFWEGGEIPWIWKPLPTTDPPPSPLPLSTPSNSNSCMSVCACCHDQDRFIWSQVKNGGELYANTTTPSQYLIHTGPPLNDTCLKRVQEGMKLGAIPILSDDAIWKNGVSVGYRCSIGCTSGEPERWITAISEILTKTTPGLHQQMSKALESHLFLQNGWHEAVENWESHYSSSLEKTSSLIEKTTSG